jgi:hypothetical protein
VSPALMAASDRDLYSQQMSLAWYQNMDGSCNIPRICSIKSYPNGGCNKGFEPNWYKLNQIHFEFKIRSEFDFSFEFC